jgi:hypothetical protein
VSKVLPFFNVLLSYLKCGMTHIHTAIQDDSLAMLDTLLVSTPLLVAASADTILCNFLDMISSLKTDSSPERTLTVNLSNRFTSVTWRMKVLRRLKDLLCAVAAYKNQQGRKNIEHSGDSSENNACSYGKTLVICSVFHDILVEVAGCLDMHDKGLYNLCCNWTHAIFLKRVFICARMAHSGYRLGGQGFISSRSKDFFLVSHMLTGSGTY